MIAESSSIKSFTDLIAWQKGHNLVLLIYQMTEEFPSREHFGLANQLRRASVSVTSNIAEAFGRQNAREQTHFFHISLGSVKEIQNQILICRDLGYVDKSQFDKVASLTVECSRLVQGLIRSSKKREGVK